MSGPPRWAEALLARRVPPELRDEVAADLEEEHAQLAAASGRLRADLWYAGQVLRLRPAPLRRGLRALDGRWTRPGRSLPSPIPGALMDTLVQDVRYALRRLWATPGFTLIAILSLGLGIGANTAVFSLVSRILLSDPGVGDPETQVDIFQGAYSAVSHTQVEEMAELGVFSDATAYFEFQARVESPAGDEMLWGELVSGDYFGTLRVPMALGRDFTAEERDVEGAHPVAILDHRFWTRAFGGDPSAIGQTIRINTRPYTIVGVAPKGFEGKALPVVGGDLYVPYAMRGELRDNGPDTDNMGASARLAPGVTPAQAQAALATLAARLRGGPDEDNGFRGFTLYTADEILLKPGVDEAATPLAFLLMGVVCLVLLIACTNLASFLLARAADRRREFAVRLALGAERGRIVALLITEALTLGLLGGIAGIALGTAAVRLLLRVRPPFDFPMDISAPLDGRVLLFATAVSVVTAVLFGLVPAIQGSRAEVAMTLRDEATGVIGGRGRVSLRAALVTVQVAISLVLLTGAGLFVRSLGAASRVDPGFTPEPVAVIQLEPHTSGYDDARAHALYDDLLRRASAIPGVEAAALVNLLPLELWNSNVLVRLPEWAPDQAVRIEDAVASPGFFATMDIAITQGREFDEGDHADAPRAVVLNEAAAERLWPDDPNPSAGAVGRSLFVGDWADPVTVIGVAETIKINTLSEAPRPHLWQAIAQTPAVDAWLIARGREPAAALAARLREAAEEADPDLFVRGEGSAAQTVALQLYLPRMGATILAIMGAIGLTLAAIGLYGVVSYAVARRTREVGIRMSLGARGSSVVALMMKGGVGLVLAGVGIGMVLALAASRLIAGFLFGVSPLDPVTFVAVPLVLIGVAALASWLPARHAARVDPMRTLRSD